MRSLIDLLWPEWKTVEEQIEVLSVELERISATDAGCTRIRKIPGIEPIVATAIVAVIGKRTLAMPGMQETEGILLVGKLAFVTPP
jgi:transposase